ncbi:MAG: TonB-dependent receptor [Bacteroidales bacterium]|nr:TonB-dependent receptor [Bacteroidales bacterium]
MAQNVKKSHTVSGYITDAKSQETLLGASVYDAATMKGAVTNNYGYYTLKLPDGAVSLKASFVGFEPYESAFQLKSDTVINIALAQSNQLNEVTVTARAIESNVKGTQMSTIELPVMQLKKVPALFGETDVIKALQLMPGVQSGTEGSAGMYVRGGGPDENLILLDGVPLYNVNHAAGFFSAFNSDAIKNVTLYKGNFPARFGGRLSSVVDVRMKDGDMYEYHGNVSIGLIAAKVNVEGPIVKGKTSFNLSFRRTYYDFITAPLINYMVKRETETGSNSAWGGYYFYDLNLKLNHRFSDKDRLFFSLYSGDDKVYANVKYKDDYQSSNYGFVNATQKLNLNWKWGNRVAALRWNHIIQPNLFMNVTGAYTQYRHYMGAEIIGEEIQDDHGQVSTYSESMNLGLNSGIYDLSAKADFDYKPFENHDVKFGASLTHHIYRPTTTGIHINESEDGHTSFAYDSVTSDSRIRALESDLYVEDNWNINDYFKLNAGLHFSTFSVDQKTYPSLQPRVSLRALVTDDFSIKAGYASMSQYIHLLSSNAISLPTDLWVPVTGHVVPMNAHQFGVGAFYDWKGFEFSVEGYFKKMNNVMEYKDGASFFSLDQSDWQDKVVMGEGWSYGVELFAQKQVGKLTGWVGYTWSHADRLFDRPGQELNFGRVFPAKYDRRHDLNIVLMYEFNDRVDVGATWIYSTGNCATLTLQDYHGLNTGNYATQTIGYVESRNNYRYNSYQRLDLVANFHKQKKYCERIFSISVYNTLCHNNPFIVIPKTSTSFDPTTGEETTIKMLDQICIFPIIPTVTWQYKF